MSVPTTISPVHKHQLLDATRHMQEWLSQLESAILQHNVPQIWILLGYDKEDPPPAMGEFFDALEAMDEDSGV